MKTKITLIVSIHVKIPRKVLRFFTKHDTKVVIATFERVIAEQVQLGTALYVSVWNMEFAQRFEFCPMNVVAVAGENMQEVVWNAQVDQRVRMHKDQGIEGAKEDLLDTVTSYLAKQNFARTGEIIVRDKDWRDS